MKIYIVNARDSVQSSVSKALEKKADGLIRTVVTRHVDRLSTMLSDSLLIIGGIYDASEYYDIHDKIRTYSNIPVAFLVDNTFKKEEVERSKSEFTVKTTFVRDDSTLTESIKAFYVDSLKTVVRRKVVSMSGITIDLDTLSCRFSDQAVLLTRTEMNILYYLVIADGVNVSHDELMKIFNIQDKVINTNTLASHVRNIKNKLSMVTGNEKIIQSVYGYGYRLSN